MNLRFSVQTEFSSNKTKQRAEQFQNQKQKFLDPQRAEVLEFTGSSNNSLNNKEALIP